MDPEDAMEARDEQKVTDLDVADAAECARHTSVKFVCPHGRKLWTFCWLCGGWAAPSGAAGA